MIDLLNNEDKKYLPIEALNSIETRIEKFSHFTDTHFAFYISESVLYFLNTLTGETGELDAFSEVEVANVKCVSNGMFIVATGEDVYIANFGQDECTVQKEYFMDYKAIRSIDATNDLSVIALCAYEDLIVISNDTLKRHDMVDAQYSMAISKDGKYIASGSKKGIEILEASSFKKNSLFETANLPISISFSPDGKTLAYGDDYAELVSISIDSEEKTVYENPFSSKPIYIEWLDKKRFIVCFLSQCVGLYSIDNKEPYELIEFPEFSSRYFQYASLINKNSIAISVENLRIDAEVESIPICDTILLQRIPS